MNMLAITYLNRASDLLFILARYANRERGDVMWVPGGERGTPSAYTTRRDWRPGGADSSQASSAVREGSLIASSTGPRPEPPARPRSASLLSSQLGMRWGRD